MNFYLGVYGLSILKDVKSMFYHYINSKQQTNSNAYTYISHIAGKIQLTIEMIYDIIYQTTEKSLDLVRDEIFDKKSNIIIMFEGLITLLKLKEFQRLKEIGIHNYIHKSIYYKEVLSLDIDEDETQKIIKNNKINLNNQVELPTISDNNTSTNTTTNLTNLNTNSSTPDTRSNSNNDNNYVKNNINQAVKELLEIKNNKSNRQYKQIDLSNFKLPPKIAKLLEETNQLKKACSFKQSNSLNNTKNAKHNTDNILNIDELGVINQHSSNSGCIYKQFNNHSTQEKSIILSYSKSKYSSFFNFLINIISEQNSFSELIYIFKPLIYLISLKKFGRKSILAFIVNAVLDYATLKKKNPRITDDTNSKGLESFTQKYLFTKEYQRRFSSALMKYLIRYPLLDYFTKPIVRRVLRIFFIPESWVDTILRFLDSLYIHHLINS